MAQLAQGLGLDPYRYSMIEPYGINILLALLLGGVLDPILWPFVALLRGLISFVFRV